MENFPDPIIEKHEQFFVLRDDLLEGGTKRRVLSKILSDIEEEEIVYPGHPYGYAGYALGLAAQSYNKKVRLFFPAPAPKPGNEIFNKTIQLKNVEFNFEDVAKQHELIPYAQNYATENNAHFMPIGFNTEPFFNELVKLAKSLNIAPEEVWCLAGSGLLCRALCKAFNAKINAVNLGMPHVIVDRERVNVFDALEKPEESSRTVPPYPSARYYDAKIWHFAKKYGTENALIWNVA